LAKSFVSVVFPAPILPAIATCIEFYISCCWCLVS